MAQNIIIDGNKLEGVEELSLLNDKGEEVAFSEGTALEDVLIELDFSDGDQAVVAGDGYLVKSAIIQKPYNLVPENIVKDKNVAGIIGTATGGGGAAGNTFIIVDYEGTEVAATLVDDVVEITAKPEDVRAGKTFISDNGVETGTATVDEGGSTAIGDHTITFMDELGVTVLCTKPVIHGDTSASPIALGLISTPTKASTQQYKYTFSGWARSTGGTKDTTALNSITEDRTVYAAFTASIVYYTIKFYDGDNVLKTQSLAYGATPTPPTPTKAGYSFLGWDTEIATVTGDASYYAQWLGVTGGECGDSGDNVVWELAPDTGVLTILGTGAMQAYTTASRPSWNEYVDLIKSVRVQSGVTSVGDAAFYQLPNLTSVSLAPTVSTIGADAFNGCTKLTTPGVDTLTSVESIGDRAYKGCTALTSIGLPTTTISLGAGVFDGCTKLSSVNINGSITAINAQAFRNCSALTSLTLPSSVTVIGDEAFASCTNLTTCSLPANLTEIGNSAFEGCSKVNVSDYHLRIPSYVTRIGSKAFKGYGKTILYVTIPARVTHIYPYAFEGHSFIYAYFDHDNYGNKSGWAAYDYLATTNEDGVAFDLGSDTENAAYLTTTYVDKYLIYKLPSA